MDSKAKYKTKRHSGKYPGGLEEEKEAAKKSGSRECEYRLRITKHELEHLHSMSDEFDLPISEIIRKGLDLFQKEYEKYGINIDKNTGDITEKIDLNNITFHVYEKLYSPEKPKKEEKDGKNS